MKPKLRIGADQSFTIAEVSEIANAFSTLFDVETYEYVELSLEQLPPIIVFALGFVSGGVASGFFEAIGSDLWNAAKQIASRVISQHRRTEVTTVRFEYEYKGKKVTLDCKSNDTKVVESAFDALTESLKEAENEPDEYVYLIFDNSAKRWRLE